MDDVLIPDKRREKRSEVALSPIRGYDKVRRIWTRKTMTSWVSYFAWFAVIQFYCVFWMVLIYAVVVAWRTSSILGMAAVAAAIPASFFLARAAIWIRRLYLKERGNYSREMKSASTPRD